MAENNSGMTEEEARSFHGYFVMMMSVFVGTAIVAHMLTWAWRPWF